MRLAYRPFWMAALAAALFACDGASAQGQKISCPANLKKTHQQMPFDFDTSTWVVPAALYVAANSGPYQIVVFTCVGNNDSKGILQFDWLVPRHQGWLEPGKISASPRLVRGTSPTPYDGCLRYGNKGDSIPAQFLGGDDDKTSIDSENKVGCRTAIARGTLGTGGGIFDFLLPFRNFFPSDSTKPKETMLQISGQIGVQKLGGDRYSSLLQYAINPSSESEGKASNATLRPAFLGAGGEALLRAFREKNPERLSLAENGTVRFEVSNVRNAALIYESYEILDVDGKVVASIAVPLFVSSER
jgi:hypothetical protein